MNNNEDILLTEEELDNVVGGQTYEYVYIQDGKYGPCYHCESTDGKISIDVPEKKWDIWLQRHTGDTIIEKNSI